jgi:DNA helicase-2/ATP-dependent DNA helicase PcrA
MTQQVNDIHMAFRTRKSIMVEAGAGCGKTTLIRTGQHMWPAMTLFMSFNKAIADELARQMPNRKAFCMTFHALCLRNLTQRLGRLKVDGYKYNRLAEKSHGYDRETANIVGSIVSNFQLNIEPIGISHTEWTTEYCLSLMTDQFKYELDISEADLVTHTEVAMHLLRESAKKLDGLTFDDMLFFVAYYARVKRWNLMDYDCVVVDEAQDVSPIRMHIVTLLSKRLIQVGDRRQAIYAFAGAMTNSMDMLADQFNCQRFPLSTTWRCSQAVIDEAATVVGNFLMPRDGVDAGNVSAMVESQLLNSSLDERSMVVCRMNAPLVKLALLLLKARIPFMLMSDFPLRLEKKVKRLAEDVRGMAGFKTKVKEYYEDRLAKAVDNKNLSKRIEDEWETIEVIAAGCERPDEVARTLIELSQSASGVVLSTGHKAKGLEADNVFILRPDLIPAPWIDPDVSPESYQQELNLKYVMVTRAKHNLIYVNKE